MSLFVLDTDILTLFEDGHPQVVHNMNRRSIDDLAVSVLTVEERLSGWYTRLRKAKSRDQLAAAYLKLKESVEILGIFKVLSFSIPAIVRYESLIAMKIGIRAMDLRIAAVVLENTAILITRNRRDFSRVPGLAIEDWTV